MITIEKDRLFALAGITQACLQVQSLARHGKVDEAVMQASLQSILVLDAINCAAVYGGQDKLQSGLDAISKGLLNSAAAHNVEVMRYGTTLMLLQAQLFSDTNKLTAFTDDIEQLSAQNSDNLVDACSAVYQKHISPMRPQIIVQGEEGYLQQQGIAEQVRAMLLAGLRSAVLWQQKGGGRFKLILQRKKYQQLAAQILAS